MRSSHQSGWTSLVASQIVECAHDPDSDGGSLAS